MDDRIRKGAQRQLESLARSLENAPDQEAMRLLTEACASLLRTFERLGPDSLGGEAREDVDAAFGSIAKAVEGHADRLRSRDAETAGRIAGSESLLKKARAEGAQLLADVRQTREDLNAQTAENAALESELRARRDDYAAACARFRRMQEELDGFYPEKYESQLRENDRLSARLDQMQAEMSTAEKRSAELTKSLSLEEEKLREIREEIAALPEFIREVADACIEQEKYLDRLRRAETEFGLDRQNQLHQEIDALEENALSMESKVKTLKNTLNNLNESFVRLDTQRQTLETDVLDRINTCLGDLSRAAALHEQSVNEVRSRADELERQIRRCEEIRKRYAAWWEADRTPLQAVQAILALSDPLNTELNTALDPAKSRRLTELNSTAERALTELDEILRACIRAAAKDRAAIAGKVSGGV